MRFDANDLRRSLDARSGSVSPGYRERVLKSLGAASPRPAIGWTAALAVVVVTVLTATSVALLVASRHGRPGAVASAPRQSLPTPTPSATATSEKLSAPSAKVVWALVGSQALYRSTDGGESWEKRSLPANAGFGSSISFVDDRQGWLLSPGSPETQCGAAPADVWRTFDGGATWQAVSTAGIALAQCKNGIWFTDALHGFIGALDPNHRPTVYRTSDGGRHWVGTTVPDNPIFVTSPGGFTLHVNWIKAFGQTAYMQASGSQDDQNWHLRDFIYISRDGGATWTWKQKLGSPYTFPVTELRWLQLAPDVEESVNGGQAFSPYDTNFVPAPPLQAEFSDAETGYVISGGAVLRTSDGGLNWTQVGAPWLSPVVISPSPSPSPIPMPTSADLSAPSADVVWALIGGRRLFLSADHGQTWVERSMPKAPGGSEATEISFVDDTYGWLTTCGRSTTLLWKTTDGARTWHTVSSGFPPDQCVLGLSFVDRSRGFISYRVDYSPPAIFTTRDGGDTWNGARIENPPGFVAGQPAYQFAALHIVRLGSAYYLAAHGSLPDGEVGWVFRSTDAGAIWTYLATTPYPADSLGFVTATRWVQLIVPGQSVETMDSGHSWHAYASDYSQAAPVAPQVVFADPKIGYATARGSIQRTTDGGLHWTALTTPGT